MLRINLIRSLRPAGKPAKSLVSRREAVIGMVLLVTAFAMLTYLASAPSPPASAPEAEPAPPQPAPAPVPAPLPESPPPPAPPPQPEACQITGITVLKQDGAVAVLVAANSPLQYKSLELSNPDRIAVDIPDCPGAGTSQAVEDSVVQRVRSGQPREGVYRLVVDVAAMPRYQIRALDRGLEIRITGGQP